MNKVKIDYVNYDVNIHNEFPLIRKCDVYSKDGIYNLFVEGTAIFNEIVDDIGYDNHGKYISVTMGQWHHSQTGKFISSEDYMDLDEFEAYLYDYVSVIVKMYLDGDYRACYHNDYDRKFTVSFIPFKKLNFTKTDSTIHLSYNLT